MQYSLYKTLAQKLNSTMPKIVRKYRKDKEFKIEYTDKKGNQKYRVLYNGGFAQKQPNKMADCDNLPPNRTYMSPCIRLSVIECTMFAL